MDAVHQRRIPRTGEGENGSASFGSLISRLLNEIVRLLDLKLDLLKAELKEELGAAARRIALLAVGGVIGALGGFFLIVALAVWVGELVGNMPGGFAIIGGVLAIAGGLLLATMAARLGEQRFVPRQTAQEIRRDVEWIKHEL
jgi:Putative Actinobacterial Holin-X, holin superfamily III